MNGDSIKDCLAVLFCLRAVYTDVRTHKVENVWILCCLILTLGAVLCTDGNGGAWRLADSLGGGFLPLFLLGPFFRIRAIGAGDLKLLSVLGLLYGSRDSFNILVLTFVFAGITALWTLVRFRLKGDRTEKSRRDYLVNYVRQSVRRGRMAPYRREGFHRENMHMTIYILAAVLAKTALYGVH
uniref:prepilin peptidase n=1 Tax=Eubacterium cellulosolvens TaxID=29322 RepID=UPI00047FA81F|nr:A24 family peptidase [[Eubacterium] cellulosolvens]